MELFLIEQQKWLCPICKGRDIAVLEIYNVNTYVRKKASNKSVKYLYEEIRIKAKYSRYLGGSCG